MKDQYYEVINLENCEDFLEKYGTEMITENREFPIQSMNEFVGASCALDGEYIAGIDKLHGKVLHFKRIIHGYELDFTVWDYDFVPNSQGGVQCNIYGGKIHLYLSEQKAVNLRYYWHNVTWTAIVVFFCELVWNIALFNAVHFDKGLPLIGKHLAKINSILVILSIVILIITIIWLIYAYRHYWRDHLILKNEKLTKMNQ